MVWVAWRAPLLIVHELEAAYLVNLSFIEYFDSVKQLKEALADSKI